MKVAGLDYASRGHSAISVAVNGIPKSASTFKSDARTDEADGTMLVEYEHWLTFKLGLIKPDIIIVEHLAVFQNAKVIRALSHREAVCLMVGKKKAPICISRTIGQARGVIFKNGNIGKNDAWDQRDKFIDFDFGKKTAGGLDKMDAMTLALAAPVLLERK